MAGRPRLLPGNAGSKADLETMQRLHQSRNEIYGLLLATFSNHFGFWLNRFSTRSQTVTSTQLAPSSCEAGAGQPFVSTKIHQAYGAIPICLAKSATSPCQYQSAACPRFLRS